MSALAFELPGCLHATEPPPVRDAVRLMVASRGDGSLEHARFHDLPDHLRPGDLLVVNVSATLPAAVPARRGAEAAELRFATAAPDLSRGSWWIVELRTADGSQPVPRLRRRDRRAARRRVRRARRALRGRRAAVARARPRRHAAARLPRGPRAPDPLRLRPARVAARRLPDGVRDRARQRRDAERRASVHARADHPPRGGRRARRAHHPAHRCVIARTRRVAVPRALRGAGADRPARRRRALVGRPGDRGRHHRRPRARDRRRRRRPRRGRRGMDPSGRHARARPVGGRRADHRLARAGGVAPPAARGGRRPRAARAQLLRGARPRLPAGTNSGTPT